MPSNFSVQIKQHNKDKDKKPDEVHPISVYGENVKKQKRMFFWILLLLWVPVNYFRRPFKLVKIMRDVFHETEIDNIKRGFFWKMRKQRINMTDFVPIRALFNELNSCTKVQSYDIQYVSQNKMKIRYKMETAEMKHYDIEI